MRSCFFNKIHKLFKLVRSVWIFGIDSFLEHLINLHIFALFILHGLLFNKLNKIQICFSAIRLYRHVILSVLKLQKDVVSSFDIEFEVKLAVVNYSLILRQFLRRFSHQSEHLRLYLFVERYCAVPLTRNEISTQRIKSYWPARISALGLYHIHCFLLIPHLQELVCPKRLGSSLTDHNERVEELQELFFLYPEILGTALVFACWIRDNLYYFLTCGGALQLPNTIYRSRVELGLGRTTDTYRPNYVRLPDVVLDFLEDPGMITLSLY